MTGLLLKDLLNLKKTAKQYLMILAAMAVLAYIEKNAMFVSMYATLCSAMLVLTSFSYDEYAHFDKYALTMPIGKRTLVMEKYLLLVLCIGVGTVVGILFGSAFSMVLGTDIGEALLISVVISSLFFIVYCVVLPVVFQVGVEKARITMVVIYLLIFLAIYGLGNLLGVMDQDMQLLEKTGSIWGILGALLGVCGVSFAVSYGISVKIMEKKEW